MEYDFEILTFDGHTYKGDIQFEVDEWHRNQEKPELDPPLIDWTRQDLVFSGREEAEDYLIANGLDNDKQYAVRFYPEIKNAYLIDRVHRESESLLNEMDRAAHYYDSLSWDYLACKKCGSCYNLELLVDRIRNYESLSYELMKQHIDSIVTRGLTDESEVNSDNLLCDLKKAMSCLLCGECFLTVSTLIALETKVTKLATTVMALRMKKKRYDHNNPSWAVIVKKPKPIKEIAIP